MLIRKIYFISAALLLLFSCEKKKYDEAYVKIISPSNGSSFKSSDTINFVCEAQTSGEMLEFDYTMFKLTNTKNNEILIDSYLTSLIRFVPNFTDTVVLKASAEYWIEDATEADKVHQIYITIYP